MRKGSWQMRALLVSTALCLGAALSAVSAGAQPLPQASANTQASGDEVSMAPVVADKAQDGETTVSEDASQPPEAAQVALPAQDDFYCVQRKLGTWFYCEKPKPKAKAQEPAAAPAMVPAVSYRDRLDVIGKQLEEMKAKAILEPTTENVVSYIRFQREQLDRASMFTDVWSRAIWQHPDIDYTLQRPVNTLGKAAWIEQRKNDRDAVMARLPERYGLYYFYSGTCGACQVFSPILRSMSDKYHLTVLPVSMDGGANRYFQRFVVNQGQYEKMGLEGGQVPALVLFDTYLKRPIPVGYGVMAEDEVVDRIFYLTSVKPGSDY